jgi:16S rRNA (uracil1498-N3)-methyltransferase
MRRYWVPQEAIQGDQVSLRGEILHHIRDVCRQHRGSRFEVIDPKGQAHLVEIVNESKAESLANIIETRMIPEIPKPHIHLALSVPHFPVFEAVLEKSVELGVKSIRPFFSEFSFIRSKADVFAQKRKRFEKIIVGATQQSGRGDLMVLEDPVGLDELLPNFNLQGAARGLFAYEGEGVLNARQGLAGLRPPGSSEAPADIWIFAGSEGGFSGREVDIFKNFGLQAVTLGQQVLRVETACVALISIIKYDFDLMR